MTVPPTESLRPAHIPISDLAFEQKEGQQAPMMRPDQLMSLLSMFSSELFRFKLTEEDARRLLSMREPLYDGLDRMLKRLLDFENHMVVHQYITGAINHSASLHTLLRQAGVKASPPLETGHPDYDPPQSLPSEFRVVSLTATIANSKLRKTMAAAGLRSATLREALSLTARLPDFFEHFPRLILFERSSHDDTEQIWQFATLLGGDLELTNRFVSSSALLQRNEWFALVTDRDGLAPARSDSCA